MIEQQFNCPHCKKLIQINKRGMIFPNDFVQSQSKEWRAKLIKYCEDIGFIIKDRKDET